jgi:hypothetical protein
VGVWVVGGGCVGGRRWVCGWSAVGVWVGGYLLRDECSLVASDACMVMNTGSPAVYDTQTQTLTNCLSD